MTEVAAAAGVSRVTLYAHFSSREELLAAAVDQSIADTDHVLARLGLDAQPPLVAVEQLLRGAWPILDAHRKVRTAALAELGPEALRAHHDRVLHHVERLIGRGRDEGAFRSDLPLAWLVATFYGVLHTAADEVDAGRLDADAAPELLIATTRSILVAT